MAKNKKTRKTIKVSGRLTALLAVVLAASGIATTSLVKADQFDEQINALRAQNSQAQDAVNGLQSQANSYQDAINKLQAQIDAVQGAISANQAKQADLQNQITQEQAQLDYQRKVLGEDVKSMYVDGQMSTIEELATSKNLSDFVDKEEYRTAVQNKIQDTMTEITKLQQQLQSQKNEVDQLIKDETAQQSQLASDQAQQQQMLAYTDSQKDQYNQQISANSSKIADLRRQQIIANSAYNIGSFKGDPNAGGYPAVWMNAPQDSLIDSWGMYNRECVSYTAFKVHQDYMNGKDSHDMPYWGGSGNANQWDDNARAAGIPVDTNPTPGSIAISNAGAYGHAMYVEQVGTINGQQAIYVSQFNADLTGHYSEGWRYTTGLVFLHF